jgi:crossover junction endodeoxyribonuclease RusA
VNGRRHRSAELRRFRKQVQAYVEAQSLAGRLPASLRARRNPSYLAVYADFFFSARQRRDVDSGLKALLDALCAPLGLNDNRVVDIHLTRRITSRQPYTLVQLEPLADWVFDAQHPVLPPPAPDAPAAQ